MLSQFACGNWVKNTKIPVSRGAWSRTWDGAEALVHEEMKSLLVDEWPEDSQFRPLNSWYASCMDTARVDTLGNMPLQPMLERISSIQTLEDLQDVLVDLIVLGSPNFAKFTVSIGYRDKNHNLLFISAAGLTMPDPSWYPNVTFPSTEPVQRMGGPSFGPDAHDSHSDDRAHIADYLQTLNELAGASPATASLLADQTLEAEALLAQWQVDEPPSSDALGPDVMTLSELEGANPNTPWRRVFERMHAECAQYGYSCNDGLLGDEKLIVMGAPFFFRQLDSALAKHELIHTMWKPLLRSQYIYALAPVLSSKFLLANLKLQSYLEGTSALQPRQKKCIAATSAGLSALTDMAYVHKFFPNASAAEGAALLAHVKAAFVQNLAAVPWMDGATRSHALAKAYKMRLNLGGDII